jgi:hypothetical protein
MTLCAQCYMLKGGSLLDITEIRLITRQGKGFIFSQKSINQDTNSKFT